MALGTTTDFTITRTELIELAHSMIGVTNPSQSDLDIAKKELGLLVRFLDAKYEWMHKIDTTESELTLTANQSEYGYTDGSGADEIAPDIVKLEWAAVKFSDNNRERLVLFDKQTALSTPLKDDASSQPLAVHLEIAPLRANNKMIFYPTPSSNYTIVYAYRAPLFDFDTASDNPDLLQEWFIALKTMLAYQLAPHHGVSLNERQVLLGESQRLIRELEAHLAPEPTYLPLKAEYM